MRYVQQVVCGISAATLFGTATTLGASDLLSIILHGKPQYSSNSCRSYALALAIGTLPNSPYPVSTAAELRKAEKDLQLHLDHTAKQLGKDPDGNDYNAGNHYVWQKAVEQMTGGIQIVLAYYDEASFFQQLEKVTNPLIRSDAVSIAQWSMAPVMTSVKRIGTTTYNAGHIVSIYGLASPPTTKPMTPFERPIALFNPAVMVASEDRNACEIDDVRNDDRWSAIASVETDYELKSFSNKFLFMTVTYAPTTSVPLAAPSNLRILP